MHQRADGLKVGGAFAAIYVLWGGTYLAIALGLQSIPAFILIASRSLIGGGVLLLLSYFRVSKLRPLGDWGHAAVGGAFLFIGCHGALAYAQRQVPSGLSAVLLATIPFWIVLVNVVIARSEPLGKLLGLLPGFAGVALIAWHETSSSTRPLSWRMMLLVAGFCVILGRGKRLFATTSRPYSERPARRHAAHLWWRRLANPQHDCRRVERICACIRHCDVDRRHALPCAARERGRQHGVSLASRPHGGTNRRDIHFREPGYRAAARLVGA
jgi:hypothetical protein